LTDPTHQTAGRDVGRRGQQHLTIQQGQCRLDAAQRADPFRQLLIIADFLAGVGLDRDMAVDAQKTRDQLGLEPAHDRGDDDQCRYAERDADQRKDRDDRNEPFALACAQVTAGDGAFECSKHGWGQARRSTPAEIRVSASSGVSSTRSPLARRFSSILPEAAPRGPTTSCHGWPIRSASLNLTPARSSRSSYKASAPNASYNFAQAASQAASPGFRFRMAARNGATDSGQMMPASSWLASIPAPTRRDTPMP